MAKFIIIVRSHLPLVFQSRVLATTPIPNGIYKFWPEPVFVFAMQIYAPPISQPIRTSARQPISTFNNPPISGSPGGHSPGLHPARPGLHSDGAARPAQPGEAARSGPGGLRSPGDHLGGGGAPAGSNGRRLPIGHCDGLLPAGVSEHHLLELS